MGESIYKFVRREIPGAFRRAWKIEQDRLDRLGKSCWSWDSEILHSDHHAHPRRSRPGRE